MNGGPAPIPESARNKFRGLVGRVDGVSGETAAVVLNKIWDAAVPEGGRAAYHHVSCCMLQEAAYGLEPPIVFRRRLLSEGGGLMEMNNVSQMMLSCLRC